MEKAKKNSKKKWIVLGGAFIVIAVLVIVGVILFSRNDVKFKLESKLGLNRTSVELRKLENGEISTEMMSFEDFLKLDNVQENQSLMLINGENLLSGDFEADIGEYKDTGVLMNVCMRDDYAKMSAEIIEKFGTKLFVMSSFRTAEEQDEILSEQGSDTAQKSGASEHQSGLALDVYVSGFAGEGFLKSDVGKWVNENCWKYGFVVRYGYGKSDVTGIEFEPWHIRYVGYPHAEIMYQNNLSLEEYLESLENGEFYSFGGYIITRQKGDKLEIPTSCESIVISSDNAGGYVIVAKEE